MNELIDKNLKLLFESKDSIKYITLFRKLDGSSCMKHECENIAELLFNEDLILPLKKERVEISRKGSEVSENEGWLKFLESEKENKKEDNNLNITNNFNNSTIGQINQDSDFSTSPININVNATPTKNQKKSILEIISNNKLLSSLMVAIVIYILNLNRVNDFINNIISNI